MRDASTVAASSSQAGGCRPKRAFRTAVVALTALLAACSHPRYYAGAEHRLATDDHFAAQGHFAVYYPAEIALDFPGYVVGLEMTDRAALPPESELQVEPMRHAGASIERLTRRLREGAPGPDATTGEGQVPFISHVVRYRGQPMGAGNCALYSVYQSTRPAPRGMAARSGLQEAFSSSRTPCGRRRPDDGRVPACRPAGAHR